MSLQEPLMPIFFEVPPFGLPCERKEQSRGISCSPQRFPLSLPLKVHSGRGIRSQSSRKSLGFRADGLIS
jgi:hypothetical protein